MSEVWKDVPNYEDLYQVSNLGRVKRLPSRCRRKTIILIPALKRTGYYNIGLTKNGVRKWHLVHRLVGLAFIDNTDNKPQINHKDGIKTNNNVDNLEWNTRSENQKHAYRTGLIDSKGERHSHNKLNNKDVFQIRRLLEQKLTQREIASYFNVTQRCIGNIKRNKSWTHLYKGEIDE